MIAAVATRKCRDVDMLAAKSVKSAKLAVGTDLSSASEMNTAHNKALTLVLDKQAPVRKKMVTIRASQPWFSDETHMAKRAAVRRWSIIGLTVNKEVYLNARTFRNGLLDPKHLTTTTNSLRLVEL